VSNAVEYFLGKGVLRMELHGENIAQKRSKIKIIEIIKIIPDFFYLM
jgi:hypothetical protein